MINTKFTKGPWHWNEDKWSGGWSGLYSGETPVLVPQSCNDGDDGNAWIATTEDAGELGLTDADKDLISSAPALCEALEIMLADYCEASEDFDKPSQAYADTVIKQARSALSKVRGDTK